MSDVPDQHWRFTPDAVALFCATTGALSRIHRYEDGGDGMGGHAIVPGMLTFLLLEDLARGLTEPPLHLDATFLKPIPVGAEVTAHIHSNRTHDGWDVDVLLTGELAAIGRVTVQPSP